jgi:hypothetical protein
MFAQDEISFDGSRLCQANPIIPDPWEEGNPDLSIILPLVSMPPTMPPTIVHSEELLEICPAVIAGSQEVTAHGVNSTVEPVEVLLKNELKLHNCLADMYKARVEKALALLYWLSKNPEDTIASSFSPL